MVKTKGCGSLTAGRTTHAGHVLSQVLEKIYHGPPGWGLDVGLTSSFCKNPVVSKPWQRGGCDPKTCQTAIEEEYERF